MVGTTALKMHGLEFFDAIAVVDITVPLACLFVDRLVFLRLSQSTVVV